MQRGRFTPKDAFRDFAEGLLRVVNNQGEVKKDEPKDAVNEDDEKADAIGEQSAVATQQAVDA